MRPPKKILLLFLTSLSMLLWIWTLVESPGRSQEPPPLLAITSVESFPKEDGLEVRVQGQFSAADVHAVTWLNTGNRQAVTGSLPMWGSLRTLAVQGRYAIAANNTRGVQVLDLSHPDTPRMVGTIPTDDAALDLVVRENFAYVADRRGGLQVIDVSRPEEPSRVAALPLPGPCLSIKTRDRLAFVAAGLQGLHIIDIDTPSRPRLLSTLPLESALDVVVHEKALYVSDPKRGLMVVDVSSPESPQVVAMVPSSCTNLFLVDTFLYLSDPSGTLTVLDVTTPHSPHPVNTVTLITGIRGLAREGDLGYAAVGICGVLLLDLSDPGNPKPAGRVHVNGITLNAVSADGRIFLAAGKRGVVVLDPKELRPASEYPRLSPVKGDLTLHGDHLFMGGNFLSSWRTLENGEAQFRSSVPLPPYSRILRVIDDTVILQLYESGILFFDMADPAHPRLLYGLENRRAIFDAVQKEQHLFLSVGEEGILIYEKREDAYRLAGTFTLPEKAGRMIAHQNRLFILAPKELYAVDVSDPVRPALITRVTLPWHIQRLESTVAEMTISNNTLFISNGVGGLLAVDRIDSDAPRLCGVLDTPGGARGLIVEGDRAYLIDWTVGIQVLDIRDPARMRIIATLEGWASMYGLVKRGEWLYITCSEEGLVAYPAPRDLVLLERSETELRFVLPSANLPPGSYDLRLSQGGEGVTLPSALEIIP